MRTQARVVVIGGGVVGCSVLYHLTKFGWKDVMLVERSELTSGSSWHAAGGMHTLNGDPNISKLQKYTIDLYKELEEISGQSCGIHITGGYMCASTQERMDFMKTMVSRGRYLGIDVDFVSLEEVAREHPLVDTSHFIGAIHDSIDGHIDPSGVTHAYAAAARIGGAEIVRNNRVVELKPTKDGEWDVVTEQGTIRAQHVVNCGGLWAREVGRMVGLELPLLAMEHHYLLTEDVPEIAARTEELPHLVDFEAELYTRQEGKGFLLGTYEKACVPWSRHETPWDFGHELLQPDFDRIGPSLDVAFKHFPFLEKAGIKRAINGPFTFAPDGNPLVGPVEGLPGFWCACAVMAGFSQGGGVGKSLAEWMIGGEPEVDIFGMDVARFGPWATKGYAFEKVKENYSRRFQVTFPNEELKAARPLRRTPIYDRLKAANAVFGASYGLEHALWFAPRGTEPVEHVTFKRSNAFGPVAEECAAVRDGVGLYETSGFAKYDVKGPEAEAWLSNLLANKMPRQGRICLTPMLSTSGRVIGDFTVAKLSDEHFMVFGSGHAEAYHTRWFERQASAGVTVTSRGRDLVGLSVAGPKSRDVMAAITHEDVGREAMPFMSFKRMHLGILDAYVGRITFTGELGYEIWVRSDEQILLYEMLLEAGAPHGIRHFGGRALNSLRLEKSFGGFTREYTPDYTPFESNLDRFVNLDKNRFIGRDALLKARDAGPAVKLVTFSLETDDADAFGAEAIFFDGKPVGRITSGGFGHATNKSIAMGYVPAEIADAIEGWEVEVMGVRCKAARAAEPLHDPKGERMRKG